MANLNFADLERVLIAISFSEGLKILFLYSLNKIDLSVLISGKYLDGFAFIF